MKKHLLKFKNKYIITLTVFGLYVLFLDDIDIFTIFSQNRKLSELKIIEQKTSIKLAETQTLLLKLKTNNGIEEYAREKKFFKRDNEDIFVISEE